MLTKVSYSNYLFGTLPIIEYSKNKLYDKIQDNLNGLLLVNISNFTYIYDYKKKKIYYTDRIPLEIGIDNIIVWKQIDSFDQNNPKIANKIRLKVKKYLCELKSENIIGIGGEYYIYFKLLSYKKYFGLSNHQSIIDDSNYNFDLMKNYSSYLTDYNNLKSFPNLSNELKYDVVINVVNIHENIIKFIMNYTFEKIIIVTCVPIEKKIKMLNKYLKLIKFEHFLNISSWVTVCVFVKKL